MAMDSLCPYIVMGVILYVPFTLFFAYADNTRLLGDYLFVAFFSLLATVVWPLTLLVVVGATATYSYAIGSKLA